MMVRRFLRLPVVPVPVHIRAGSSPNVSIVVPCFDRWEYTNRCLLALAACWDEDIPAEVLVVDDGSADETNALLERSSGIRVIRNPVNVGFVGAANAGAREAHGRFLHFLNNDTIVTEGWMRPLLETFARDDRIAGVSSQLRHPNDDLAEAGSVIWRDAQGSNYGRDGSPHDWRYRYVRDIDYGSAASFMVRRDRFEAAGGFSTLFAPAYYEDVDLCFALRQQGDRVVYQPRSVVYHLEGISYGSNLDAAAIALQESNRGKFQDKWPDELDRRFEPEPALIEVAARRLCGKRTAIVVDEHVPFFDRDAGSDRMRFLLHRLLERGYHVIFGSIDREEYEPYTVALRDAGVETIVGFNRTTVRRLASMALSVDVAWLSRPGPAAALIDAFRSDFPEARILYDTVDLHYLRLEREERITGRRTKWQATRRRELQLAEQADITVVTSLVERELLALEGVANAAVVSVSQAYVDASFPSFEERHGIVFFGNFGHAPNIDAAAWLCREIMPHIRKAAPEIALTIAGADPPAAVRRLATHGITVTGYVERIDDLLMRHRVFIAPLRFGAGVKGKTLRALAVGLPVVTTAVGAEGIFGEGECALADDASSFAAATVGLYRDKERWASLATQTREVAERFSVERIAAQLDSVLPSDDNREQRDADAKKT